MQQSTKLGGRSTNKGRRRRVTIKQAGVLLTRADMKIASSFLRERRKSALLLNKRVDGGSMLPTRRKRTG